MKNLLIALVLTVAPSCAGLGPNSTDAETESTIEMIEQVTRDTGNAIFPGLGVAAALGAGFFARAYAKKRKAGKVTTVAP
jgi:hypothetical protein